MSAAPFVLLGAGLFALGLFGLFARRNVVLKLVAVNIAASGAFVVLVAAAPRLADGATDPLPQALVLTGIVISVAVTALALALVRRLGERDVGERDVGEREGPRHGRVTLHHDRDAS